MKDDTIPFSARQCCGLAVLALGYAWAVGAAPAPGPAPQAHPPARPGCCRHLCGSWDLDWGGWPGTLELDPDGTCRTALNDEDYHGSWRVRDGCLWCSEWQDGAGQEWLVQYPLWGDSHVGVYHARALVSRNGGPLREDEWFELRRAGK